MTSRSWFLFGVIMLSLSVAGDRVFAATVNSLPSPDTSEDHNQLIGGIFQPLVNGTLSNFTVDAGVTGSTCYVYYTANTSLLTSAARNGTNCPVNTYWTTNQNYTLAVGTPSTSTTHRYKAAQITLPLNYTSVKYWCKAASDDNGASFSLNGCGTVYHFNIVTITTVDGELLTVNTLPTPDTSEDHNQLIGGVFAPLVEGTLHSVSVAPNVTGSSCEVFDGGTNALLALTARSAECVFDLPWSVGHNYTIVVGTPGSTSTHVYNQSQVTLPINYSTVSYLCKTASNDSGATWESYCNQLVFPYDLLALTTRPVLALASFARIVENDLPVPDTSEDHAQLLGGVFQPLVNGTLINFTLASGVTGSTCYVYYTGNGSLVKSVGRTGITCRMNVVWSTNTNYTLAVGTPGSTSTHRYKASQVTLPLTYDTVQYLCKAASTDDGATWSENACGGSAYHFNIVAITTGSDAVVNQTVNTLPAPDTSESHNQLIGGVFQPLTNGTLANFTLDSGVTGSTCYVYYTGNNSLVTSVSKSGTNCPVNVTWTTGTNYTLAVGTASTSTTHRYKSAQVTLPIDYASVRYLCKTSTDDNAATWTTYCNQAVYHFNIDAITTVP